MYVSWSELAFKHTSNKPTVNNEYMNMNMNNDNTAEKNWHQIGEILQNAAEKLLPPKPLDSKQKQMKDTILSCTTNYYHSSLEHATYGTSCLPLAFLNLTTCHLSNLRSINLI